MSYTEKEAKILIDFHRQYGRAEDENECIDCRQPIDEQHKLCTRCWHDREREKQERDPLDDLPDNLDDYCDDCGHAPERCKCNRHLEALEDFADAIIADDTPTHEDRLRLIWWWSGYCAGKDLSFDMKRAGQDIIDKMR